MPASEFSRALTASLASIRFTRKCLPTSRRKSSAERLSVHSRLLTIRAAYGPVKSRNGSICARTRSIHPAITSREWSTRSALGRGSPIRPVAPPTRASGRLPPCWSRRIVMIWVR